MKQAEILALAVMAAALGGCANMTETQKGTAAGAGIGAVAGGVIGAATAGGHRGRSATTGAAAGAAIGALGGYIWSKKMEEQRAKMAEASKGTGIDVSKTADNRLKLNIPADAGFDVGRSEIKPALGSVLTKFSSTLNEHTVTAISIVGHTDNTGSDAVNNPLSIQRANATRDFLMARGVAMNRITTAGRGEREPIAGNDSDAGRAQNRRVEIYIAEAAAQESARRGKRRTAAISTHGRALRRRSFLLALSAAPIAACGGGSAAQAPPVARGSRLRGVGITQQSQTWSALSSPSPSRGRRRGFAKRSFAPPKRRAHTSARLRNGWGWVAEPVRPHPPPNRCAATVRLAGRTGCGGARPSLANPRLAPLEEGRVCRPSSQLLSKTAALQDGRRLNAAAAWGSR
jgi:outer membrane protein OmpA-like peptidoglycan-associated protein